MLCAPEGGSLCGCNTLHERGMTHLVLDGDHGGEDELAAHRRVQQLNHVLLPRIEARVLHVDHHIQGRK